MERQGRLKAALPYRDVSGQTAWIRMRNRESGSHLPCGIRVHPGC